MVVKLLGVRTVDFTPTFGDRKGERVTGTKIFFCYPSDRMLGQECDSRFIQNPDLIAVDLSKFIDKEIILDFDSKNHLVGISG